MHRNVASCSSNRRRSLRAWPWPAIGFLLCCLYTGAAETITLDFQDGQPCPGSCLQAIPYGRYLPRGLVIQGIYVATGEGNLGQMQNNPLIWNLNKVSRFSFCTTNSTSGNIIPAVTDKVAFLVAIPVYGGQMRAKVTVYGLTGQLDSFYTPVLGLDDQNQIIYEWIELQHPVADIFSVMVEPAVDTSYSNVFLDDLEYNTPKVAPSDLRVYSFSSDATGSVALQFENAGPPTASSFAVTVHWAKGPSVSDGLIEPPLLTNRWSAGFQGVSGTFVISSARFWTAPEEATHLLLTVDGNHEVEDENRANNVAVLPRLDFVALEVNQAVQDWNNSVTLVEGKKTMVRGFFTLPTNGKGGPVQGDALLYGSTLNGTVLPYSPMKGSTALVMDTLGEGIDRTDLNRSFNFFLPPSWQSNQVSLRLSITNAVVLGSTLTYANYIKVPRLPVKFLRIKTKTTEAPSLAQLAMLEARLVSMFPVSTLETSEDFFNFDGNEPKTIDEFKALNVKLAVPSSSLIYGMIKPGSEPPDGPTLGMASSYGQATPGMFFISAASGRASVDPSAYTRDVHAHEIGHLLSLRHPWTNYIDGVWSGTCGEETDGVYPRWPYYWYNGQYLGAAIGPMDPHDFKAILWGCETHRDKVISPFQHFELMSYCPGTGDPDGPWHWISKTNYSRLTGAIQWRFGSAAKLDGNGVYDCGLVRGVLEGPTRLMSLQPIHPFQSPQPPDSGTQGEYALRQYNAQGQLLYFLPFTPERMIPEQGSGGDGQMWMFSLLVPMSPDVQRIDIVRNPGASEELAARVSRSAHGPSIVFTPPEPAGPLTSPFTLRWQGDDLDGDALTYQIEYSRDDGQTWRVIATDWTASQIELNPINLKATSAGRFRVTATDDLNTGAAVTSAPYSVGNHAPELAVDSPEAGSSIHGTGQIRFDALAVDMEDGALEGNSVKWSSDLSGALGEGNELILPATTLAEGRHQITVVATDSGGLTNAVTFTLDVSHLNRPWLVQLGGTASGDFRLRLLGDPAGVHQLEASPDLRAWTPVATGITNSTFDYTEPTPTVTGTKFYRATTSRPAAR